MPDEMLATASEGEFDEFDLNAFFEASGRDAAPVLPPSVASLTGSVRVCAGGGIPDVGAAAGDSPGIARAVLGSRAGRRTAHVGAGPAGPRDAGGRWPGT